MTVNTAQRCIAGIAIVAGLFGLYTSYWRTAPPAQVLLLWGTLLFCFLLASSKGETHE